MNRASFLSRLLTVHLPVLAIVLIALGPFLWLILTSLTPSADIAARGVALTPQGWLSLIHI